MGWRQHRQPAGDDVPRFHSEVCDPDCHDYGHHLSPFRRRGGSHSPHLLRRRGSRCFGILGKPDDSSGGFLQPCRRPSHGNGDDRNLSDVLGREAKRIDFITWRQECNSAPAATNNQNASADAHVEKAVSKPFPCAEKSGNQPVNCQPGFQCGSRPWSHRLCGGR